MTKNQPHKIPPEKPSKTHQDHDFLPYGRQTIEQDDIDAVCDALQSDFLTTGPTIASFEEQFCHVVGCEYAVAVGNGTQALHLACLAAGLQENSYAVVPSLTFLATANAVRYCGSDVLFCDVDPATGLMRAEDLQKTLDAHKDKNIRAVLPVHLTGQSVDLSAIKEICEAHNLKMITDACHALGTHYKDTQIGDGSFEDMATFSFHPVKTIAMGEGGAITTNNKELADRLRILRSHGMVASPDQGPWIYQMPELGFNYRVTDIQCALGISQLKKLDGFIAKRKSLAQYYDEKLQDLAPYILPPQRVSDCDPAWHLYAPRFDFDGLGKDRTSVMNELKARQIGTQVHYIPVHTQPYYENLYGAKSLPGAQTYYQNTLSLPLFPQMEFKDVDYVVQALRDLIPR